MLVCRYLLALNDFDHSFARDITIVVERRKGMSVEDKVFLLHLALLLLLELCHGSCFFSGGAGILLLQFSRIRHTSLGRTVSI